jgi:hypothetical protein
LQYPLPAFWENAIELVFVFRRIGIEKRLVEEEKTRTPSRGLKGLCEKIKLLAFRLETGSEKLCVKAIKTPAAKIFAPPLRAKIFPPAATAVVGYRAFAFGIRKFSVPGSCGLADIVVAWDHQGTAG